MKKKIGNLISHPLPHTAPEESFSLVGGKRLFLRSIVPQPLWLTKRKVSITILKSKFECSGEVSFSKYRFHFENLVLKFLYSWHLALTIYNGLLVGTTHYRLFSQLRVHILEEWLFRHSEAVK